jgi:two-component system invasion response regulator UvrY
MKKFLLIDDHHVIRSGIRGLLSELYVPCVIDEAADERSAMEKLAHHQYDLVMMDIHVPESDMMGLMEFLRIKYPKTKVLVFSMGAEDVYAKRFLKAGARGFVSKNAGFNQIGHAVDIILQGKKYISQALAEVLADDSISDKPSNPFQALSPREFNIITLLLNGKGVTAISQTLNIQTPTVGTHKARAFRKLGVDNIIALKELAGIYNI